MERQLDKTEKNITKKNVKRNIQKIKDLREEIGYYQDFIQFQSRWEDYQKRLREFEITSKKQSMKTAIESKRQEVKNLKRINEIVEDQIKNGVEVKTPTGVG